ncbi:MULTISPECIES: zinc metalloprotease HtpX [Campylobacter]|uniref:zinc metalloprotease HtpX n=1 Tax=Campylobacter TaxID=194 RepID=UPI000A35955A|nr:MULTISPECIES: zinc metalloprotease HtpX [unclassified Campylobacter]MCR8678652.1 zinc metalloprotease HtpX [Campylobacter sp. RM19072]MCR8696599.1 zinc metalloprotease HtpX [Campylobacter sp. RM19073]
MEIFKTAFFMVALMLLFIIVGGMIGGTGGMVVAFCIAAAMNFFSYFYSDKLILKRYNAMEIDPSHQLYHITHKLCLKAGLELPKLYIINDPTPNAFATGRNPSNAAVALTTGLVDMLNSDEIASVIAHELGHIRHYDILTGSIAAVFAGAIAILANFAQFGAMLGSNQNRQNPLLIIALAIIMPLAATIIQMSISRSREFEADKFSALITSPNDLASALLKLENSNQKAVVRNANEQTAHMFIISPFSGGIASGISNLFRTHPTTKQRVDRLRELNYQSPAKRYFNS